MEHIYKKLKRESNNGVEREEKLVVIFLYQMK